MSEKKTPAEVIAKEVVRHAPYVMFNDVPKTYFCNCDDIKSRGNRTWLEHSRHITESLVEALRANGIEMIQLPEPTPVPFIPGCVEWR